MKEYYVYELWVESEPHPFYVGKTSFGSRRFNGHLNGRLRNKSYKNYKICKALSDGLQITERIVFRSFNEKEVFDKERELIKLYGRVDRGTGFLCNHTDGGEGPSGYTRKFSKETRQKLRDANLGKKASAETKKKMSASHRTNKGLVVNGPEARRKLSLINTGKTHSEESKEKMRQIKLNSPSNKEHMQKLAAKARGVKQNKDVVRRRAEGLYKRVDAYCDGEHVGRYNSYKEAEITLGLARASVTHYLTGRRKSAVGPDSKRYTFKKVENDE